MEPRSRLLWYSAGFMFSEDQGRRQNDAAITIVAKVSTVSTQSVWDMVNVR